MSNGDPQVPPARGDVETKLKTALSALVNVRVATVISQVTVTLNEDGSLESVGVESDPVDAIVTVVNLVDGDVTTIIAPSLEDKAELRTFHDGLVDKAVKVLPENISMLVDVMKKLFG